MKNALEARQEEFPPTDCIFPENSINVTYKRNKNLKELISPYLFPKIIKENNCSIEKGSRRCDICKNFLVVFTEFTCHVTKRKYKIRGTLTCNTKNIIYLITCKCCSKQYIGSATGFKEDSEFIKAILIPVRLGVE